MSKDTYDFSDIDDILAEFHREADAAADAPRNGTASRCAPSCPTSSPPLEEHSVVGRSNTERSCGRSRRENAGISSESKVRILAVESLRFPGEGSSAQGKSGPKARPEGVVDGQQVEIPAPYACVIKP